jgi:hypothetical protein
MVSAVISVEAKADQTALLAHNSIGPAVAEALLGARTADQAGKVVVVVAVEILEVLAELMQLITGQPVQTAQQQKTV